MFIGLETDALSLSPNDQHLVRLAKQIGINLFDQFLIYLGITRDEWEEIDHQYRQNGMLGMKLMALYEWKKKNETVKLQDLLNALNGIERPHYLCQVRNYNFPILSIIFKLFCSDFTFITFFVLKINLNKGCDRLTYE